MTEPTIGVVFRPQSPPQRLRDAVLAAEAAGVAELWLWEDCFLEGGLTAAAAALAWSGRMQVGIGLLPVPLRNPALAAMEIATLANLFPGRFLPGIGHGVLDWMAQVGAGAPSPMTRLREHTGAIRDLLHGRTVHVDGTYVHLDGVALDRPPAQAPPLHVGARGPRTIRLAAELADGLILDASVTLDEVREARAAADEARAAAGRTGPFRVVVYAEVDTGADTSVDAAAERITGIARELGQAGADTVAFQGTGEALDPEPIVAAIAAARA